MKFTVIKAGINGEGIAYLDQKPVFIPGAFPGETVEAEIKDEQERYLRASLRRILVPSKARRTSPCPLSAECGGCALMELSYPAQLEVKRNLLKEALWKYGHVKEDLIRDIHPSPETLHYRSALKLPVQESEGLTVTGMYKTGTNRFVPIDQCPAHDEVLENVRRTILAILHEEQIPAYDRGHGLRYLIMRRIDETISVALITGNDTLPESLIEKISALREVRSITQSINTARNANEFFGSKPRVLFGEAAIPVHFLGYKIYLSPESFFQLNIAQAEQLYTTAVSKIDPCDVLVEAYCGVGVMSILARDKARKVFGIEYVPEAIENARRNAEVNRVPNTTFFAADAAEGLRQILAEREVNTLLCDPPRAGLDEAMIETILSSSIAKIVYVSCNPATLGKNIKDLKKEYDVRTVIPFDMFPNTPHCESVTVLTRRGTSDRVVVKHRRQKQKHKTKGGKR